MYFLQPIFVNIALAVHPATVIIGVVKYCNFVGLALLYGSAAQ
jgi:hypothetical protein